LELPKEDIYIDLDQDGSFESRFAGDELEWALKYFAQKWLRRPGRGTG